MSTKGQIKSVPFCTIFAMYWTVLTVQYKLTRRNVVARRYWIVGGGDRVSVHFAVTFLDCWRTSFCVTTITKTASRSNVNKHELVNCESSIKSCFKRLKKFRILVLYRKELIIQRYFQSNSRLSCPPP